MNMSPEKQLGFGCVKLSACQSESQAMRSGHTLIFDGKKQVLHTIPSGVFREGTQNVGGIVHDVFGMKYIYLMH